MMAAGKQGAGRAISTAAIGVLVIAVAAMMIVPLPTWVIDLLITGNLAASMVLLLAAAWARGTLAIGSFPAILVLTTLFRLGLNVSTVRLILLQADAGQVVRAFGAFVVRADYVVGFAVFLVLTIVQYVVIARGAERVAEVAARFALDAMPGKQLAIDADLRAGAVDAGEARRRREALSREAQVYGSLDGAMRFVKGDAIASILILAVSLVGGLIIGVLRRDLGLGEAARVYTLLTIGDGLASQIPALLLSTAAGLLVTRAAAEGEGREGEAIEQAGLIGQLANRPALLLAVAGLLALLALLPGMPGMPFGMVALALAVLGLGGLGARPRSGRRGALLPTQPPRILLRLGAALAGLPAVDARLEEAARRVVNDLGVPLDAVTTLHDPALAPRGFVLMLGGLPAGDGVLGEAAGGNDEATRRLCLELEEALRRHVGDLLGLDETQRLLDALAVRAPALVRETVPRRVDLPTLTRALRRLLAEGVPIGDLREVLEAIAAAPEPEHDAVRLSERLRAGLSRRITARIAPSGHLRALTLDPMVEDALRGSIRSAAAPGGVELAIEPDLAADMLASLDARLRAAPVPPVPLVILTPPDLRRHLRRLVEEQHPEVAVVSFGEVLPSVQIEAVGQLGA